MKSKDTDKLYLYRRIVFISVVSLGTTVFNFFLFTAIMVSAYHGMLAGAGTMLAVLCVSLFYYFMLFLETKFASNIVGGYARKFLAPLRISYHFTEELLLR